MKKLLLLIVFGLSLTGCVAQKNLQPLPTIVVPLTVTTIAGDEITLQSDTGRLLLAHENPKPFTVPEGLTLEEGRKYYVAFKYQETPSFQFKTRIEIIGFSIDPVQAQKDQAEIGKQFKTPTKK